MCALRYAAALWVLHVSACNLGLLAAAQESPAPGNDEAALLALRNAVTNWPAFAATSGVGGWDALTPLCQWGGVSCTDQGRVQSVTLQCDGCPVRAQGTLPPELAQLTAATTLNVQGNAFAGSLPLEWGSSSALQALQNLYLNDNQLEGSIPASWGSLGALPQLSLLRIDSNRLSGSLPAVWGSGGATNESLPNLLVLRLLNNRISGSLPPSWGSPGAFPRLQILALQNNSLTGGVPAEWEEPEAMSFLQEMYLQRNRLSGQLPGSWGRNSSWPQLRFLYLAGNPLGGTLPPEWGFPGSFPSLRVLGLNTTQVTGSLPPDWGDGGFSAADAFLLQRNELSGTIPASWAGLTSLERLVLRPGNPNLCGPVPPDLPFYICTGEDVSCLKERPTLLEGSCATAAGPAGEAAGGGVASPAPQTPEASGSSSGGGVPAAAIAVPVAVGVPLLAALAGGFAWAAARRRRRHEGEAVAQQAAQHRRQLGAHPFDTEEGRAALTSPFAAGAFQNAPPQRSGAAASHSDASSSQQAVRQGSRSPARQRGPHDSVGTQSSSVSAGSYRSYLAAKCARIETRSLPAPLGSSAESSDEAAHTAPARRAAEPGLAERVAGAAIEMQPVPLLSRSEAEERDFVGSMLLGPRGSSEQTSAEDIAAAFGELPFSDWEISPSEIKFAKRPDGTDWSLGSGGFGRVYKAFRHGVQPVAVKVLTMQGDLHQMALADFRKEIAILKACRDVNIVQFVGASLTPDHTMLVTEYMEGGNLANNITGGRVSWYRRGKKIALDVARGLVFLHSRRVVHFDLKSPNILLARDGTAKIGDVGMAKILARDYVTGVVGTLAWAAPEMLWGERCTEKADIYSFGIVLWEICSGQKPVRGQLRDLRVPEECPAGVRDLILQCLETRPSLRPSALEIVQRLQLLPGQPPEGLKVGPRAAPSPIQGSSASTMAVLPQVPVANPVPTASAADASLGAIPDTSSGGSRKGPRPLFTARSRSEGLPPLRAVADADAASGGNREVQAQPQPGAGQQQEEFGMRADWHTA